MKNTRRFTKELIVALNVWMLAFAVGCSGVKFESGSANGPSTSALGVDYVVPPETIGQPSESGGIFDMKSAINRNHVWVVTKTGTGVNVYRIELDAAAGYPMKQWAIANNPAGGLRTFVSEIGLLIGATGGAVYRVDDATPANTTLAPIYTAADSIATGRVCLTSFRINNFSYIGLGYTAAGGARKFTRIPIDMTKPNKINTATAQTAVQGTGPDSAAGYWAYGCFTDQGRKYFWSGWGHQKTYGLNLITLGALIPQNAPNQGHTNATLGARFANPALGNNPSYALAGDQDGNVLSGTGVYTYAHEGRYDYTYGSMSGASTLVVAQQACFFNKAACGLANELIEVNTTSIGKIGPMSSMNDGRMIGIVRGGNSQVYTMALKNPANLAEGLDFVRIKEVVGDAYMYSDFTGASLYAGEVTLNIDLSKLSNFKPGQAVARVGYLWTAQAGGNARWRGLRFQARCYQAGGAIPAYETVNPVNDAGKWGFITASTCNNRAINRLDVYVSPDGSPEFTRTSQLQIKILQ